MANCYRCGRPVEGTYRLRRKVKTGEHERRTYPKGGLRLVQSHFGQRVVCTKCAAILDRQAGRDRVFEDVRLLLAIAILIIVALVKIFSPWLSP